MRPLPCAAVVLACSLLGCGGENASSTMTPPAPAPSSRTGAIGGDTASMQDREPVDALNVYLSGFDFYNGDVKSQVESHYYCSALNEDVRQCVIFDGDGADAKLAGIEYVVSRRVFAQLPAGERKLWHSHAYDVKSGTLLAPGIPEAAEHEFMEQMAGTYGKTWRTWHTDRDSSLPLGHPMLMAGLTGDGQADPRLVAMRDGRLQVSSADRRRLRADIAVPEVVEGADAWEHGEVLQVTLQTTVAQTGAPPHAEPDRDQATPAPTRRIRANRAHELYAGAGAGGCRCRCRCYGFGNDECAYRYFCGVSSAVSETVTPAPASLTACPKLGVSRRYPHSVVDPFAPRFHHGRATACARNRGTRPCSRLHGCTPLSHAAVLASSRC